MKTKWPLGLILLLSIGLNGCSSESSTNSPGVTSTPATLSVTEGGATDYTLVLDGAPIADVTVTISADTQSTVSPATLTFTAANWNTPQTVTVTAVDDDLAEGLQPHSSTITHMVTNGGDPQYDDLAIGAVTVSITDNDTASVTITESSGSTDVTEGGTTDTYDVVLTSEPTDDVTIAISIPDGETSVSLTSLIWTTANWNTAQTVTVTAVDDVVLESNHTSTITHSASSANALLTPATTRSARPSPITAMAVMVASEQPNQSSVGKRSTDAHRPDGSRTRSRNCGAG